MAANVYQPHLLLLIEDDANRQIVNGFDNHPSIAPRRLDPGKVAGGWLAVLAKFENEHISLLRKYPLRHLVMVIDFDACDGAAIEARRNRFLAAIPEDLRDRVFLIGCSNEPEKLVSATRFGFEEIGRRLAQDCADGTDDMWNHPMLGHNAGELARLRAIVRPFLFAGR